MIAAGLLRHYVGIMMRSDPKRIPMNEGRAKSHLQRSARLRGGAGNFLCGSKWEARRRFLSNKEDGWLREEAFYAEEEKNNDTGAKEDMMNPMSMMDGMRGQMAFMVQNMVMMQGISHFFKGFVLVKVPFPLTTGFKMMFQRGLELTTLDTSYVSSVSWYFLVMFGLRGFFKLAIGDMSQEDMESNQRMLASGRSPTMGPQQPFDAPKMLRNEADNLELVRQKSWIDDAEKRLLGKRYPKKKISASTDIFGYGGSSTTTSSSSGGKSKKKKA
mmetsp:Transcript_7106/g.10864  ORF Transcript_7106/g.10864 Transcript_7106/m.10864 type:complete len:272 (+) Transcript_7106:406-1221(+)